MKVMAAVMALMNVYNFFFTSIGFACITFENCSLIWKDLCPVINQRRSDPKPSREEEEYIDFTWAEKP